MKIRTGWFFFFLSMVTVLPYRIYQRLFSLEINMGFPKVGDHTLEILLAILVLFTLLFLWSCGSDKEVSASYQAKPNVFAGILALLLAVSVAAESVGVFLTRNAENAVNVSKIVLSVADMLAVIFFIMLAVDTFRGVNSFEKRPYRSLALPVWALVRLAVNFMQFNAETGQENMFDSFALIGCLLFLYSQSRLLVGIERKKTLKTTFSFGFFSILTGLMCVLPRYIGYVLVHYYTLEGVSDGIYQGGLTPYPTNLIFALYVFSFLIGLYFNTYKKGKDAETALQEAEPASAPASEAPPRDNNTKTPSYFDEVTGGAPHGYPVQEHNHRTDVQLPQYPDAPYQNGGQNDYYGSPQSGQSGYGQQPSYPQQPPQPNYGSYPQYPQQPGPGGYEPESYSPGQHPYPPHQNYPR